MKKRNVIAEKELHKTAPEKLNKRQLLEAQNEELLARCTALDNELTIQHQRANDAVRALAATYTFLQQLQGSYMDAAKHYQEKPVPNMWLAARVCDHFNLLFMDENFMRSGLAPKAETLRWLHQIAGRTTLPGTIIHNYMFPPQPEAPKKQRVHPGAAGKKKK